MTRPGLDRALRLGLPIAALVVGLDQLSKFYVIHVLRLADSGPKRVAPFLDLSFVWNRGISYGLFQQDSSLGRWLLVGLSVAAVLLIWMWAARTRSPLTVVALGLIAGGAIGNAIDRALYGAVIDFLHLHGGAVWWLNFPYIFNVADAAISSGVVLLLAEQVFFEAPAQT
jgi:signal peptidase II